MFNYRERCISWRPVRRRYPACVTYHNYDIDHFTGHLYTYRGTLIRYQIIHGSFPLDKNPGDARNGVQILHLSVALFHKFLVSQRAYDRLSAAAVVDDGIFPTKASVANTVER